MGRKFVLFCYVSNDAMNDARMMLGKHYFNTIMQTVNNARMMPEHFHVKMSLPGGFDLGTCPGSPPL